MSGEYTHSVLNPNALVEHIELIIDKIESRRSAVIPSEAMPLVDKVEEGLLRWSMDRDVEEGEA